MKELTNKINKNMDKVLLIVLLIILVFTGTKKSGFHVDEFFSIINANWSVEEQKAEEAKQKNTYSGQELVNLCLVQQTDDRFDFETVWKNQASDTHPPLYYVLVHIASSLFMTRLNMIVLGLLVNIPIALLIYFFMIKLIQLFTDNKQEATIYAFLYSISFCAINSFLWFFRIFT